MAKKLETFEFGKRGRRQDDYDWNNWLDGDIWELTHLKDFKIKPGSFRTTAATAASERGLKVRTALLGDNKVVIQAFKEEVKETVTDEKTVTDA